MIDSFDIKMAPMGAKLAKRAIIRNIASYICTLPTKPRTFVTDWHRTLISGRVLRQSLFARLSPKTARGHRQD